MNKTELLQCCSQMRFSGEARMLKVREISLPALLLFLMTSGVSGQGPGTRVLLTIPSQGRGYELTRILAGSVTSNGSLVVLQNSEPFILLFDPRGHLLKSIGRRGSGPGEFRSPRVLGRRADSLWVWDVALARITVMTSSGDLVRTVMLPTAGQGTLFANGTVTVHTMRNYGYSGEKRDLLTVRPVDQVHTLLRSPTFTREYSYEVLQYPRAGTMMVGLQPFEDGPLFMPAADGTGFYFIDRRVGTKPDGSSFIVDKIGPDGDSILRIRFRYRPTPVTADHLRAAVKTLLGDGPTSNEVGLESRIRSAITKRKYLPPVTRIVSGTDGSIWVRREESLGSKVVWTVFEANGKWNFDIALDKRMSPIVVMTNRAWMVRESEDGTVSLVMIDVA